MYFIELFPVPALADADVEPLLARALDADVDPQQRIATFHALRGTPTTTLRGEVARALVAVLNEPYHWLGCEALLCVRELSTDVVIGLDRQTGLFRASPHGVDELEHDGSDLHCPSLGVVAFPMELHATFASMIERAPWLACAPALGVLLVDGVRHPIVTRYPVTIGDVEHAAIRLPRGSPTVSLHLRDADIVFSLEGSTARGAVVVGDTPLGKGGITSKPARPGGRVRIGDVDVRVVRVEPHTAPPGRALDVIMPFPTAVGGARARAQLGPGAARKLVGSDGHVVALGGREIGVVVPGAASRFLCTELAPALAVAGEVVGTIGALRVRTQRADWNGGATSIWIDAPDSPAPPPLSPFEDEE